MKDSNWLKLGKNRLNMLKSIYAVLSGLVTVLIVVAVNMLCRDISNYESEAITYVRFNIVDMKTEIVRQSMASFTQAPSTIVVFSAIAALLVIVYGSILITTDRHYCIIRPRTLLAFWIENIIVAVLLIYTIASRANSVPGFLQNPDISSPTGCMLFAILVISSAAVVATCLTLYGYHSDRRAWRIFTINNTNFGEEPLTFREYCQIDQNN